MNYLSQGYMNGYPYNYNYTNQYVQTPQPQQFMSQPLPLQSQQSQLNGKIVDSIDMVRVMEVPTNGYGVFPKADLSEVYVKAWNGNGTTNIVTFKPDNSQDTSSSSDKDVQENSINIILERINQLESKIDNIIKDTSISKKEVKVNDY